MPQKYQIEVSVSGVMKSTTMLDTLRVRRRVVAAVAGVRDADLDHHVARRREAADLPAVDTARRRPGGCRAAPRARTAARMMFDMKRLVIAESPSTRVAGAASSISGWPMLVACT